MLNKKLMILTTLIISLLAISAVNATDNATNDVVGINDANRDINLNDENVVRVDDASEDINLNNDAISVDNLQNDNLNGDITNNQDILGSSELDDKLSIANDMNVLSAKSSPPSNYYRVVVNSAQVESGGSGTIKINVDCCYYEGYYNYDFNLKIVDSHGGVKAGTRFQGTTPKSILTYSFKATAFSPGSYAIKAFNVKDGNLMSTATLTVKGSTPYPSTYPSATDYSVIVSDTTIKSGSSGSISMKISPAYGSTYAYYYYLKIYDSSGSVKISKTYSSLNKGTSETCSINSNQLSPGTYTIKITNYADSKLMCTAKLTITGTTPSPSSYPSSSAYSVTVSDTTISSSGSISMSISPASSTTYKYYYYLKVYDSNNNEKISQLYSGTSSTYSKTYTVSANQLTSGTYTIKIINYYDSNVMDTAKLTIKSTPTYPTYPTYSDYSVRFSTNVIKSDSSVSISMIISPASSSTYKYYYYLKVEDIYGNEKVSQLFYGTSSDSSKSYTMTSKQLNSGNTYNMKIVNYYDNKVMNSAMLIVNFTSISSKPSYSDYSVIVYDTSVNYGSSGSISMNIYPASSLTYKYYYYLKVYDIYGNEKISQLYYSTNSAYSKTYSINPYQLNPGNYIIKIINYNDNRVMDSAELTIGKLGTSVSAPDMSIGYGTSKNILITLKDTKGNLLIGKSISITFNGKTYSDKTNSNGQISIKVPENLAPKTYVASIKFSGDSMYIGSAGTVKVTIGKITTKVTVKNIRGYENKKVKLTAIVKDKSGKKIKKGTIKFKFKGKKYKVKVKNGKAVITIKIPKTNNRGIMYKYPKGKVTEIYEDIAYKGKVTFLGDTKYSSSSSTFKVTSMKKSKTKRI